MTYVLFHLRNKCNVYRHIDAYRHNSVVYEFIILNMFPNTFLINVKRNLLPDTAYLCNYIHGRTTITFIHNDGKFCLPCSC